MFRQFTLIGKPATASCISKLLNLLNHCVYLSLCLHGNYQQLNIESWSPHPMPHSHRSRDNSGYHTEKGHNANQHIKYPYTFPTARAVFGETFVPTTLPTSMSRFISRFPRAPILILAALCSRRSYEATSCNCLSRSFTSSRSLAAYSNFSSSAASSISASRSAIRVRSSSGSWGAWRAAPFLPAL